MLNTLSIDKRIKYALLLTVLGFLITAIYTSDLWLNERHFPVLPLLDGLPYVNHPLDYVVAAVFFGLMIYYAFKPNKLIGFSLVLLFIYLAFVDQNRLQPYFYQGVLIFFVCAFNKDNLKTKTIVLHSLMLIFIATYFWSGVHKINGVFYEEWMGALVKHFDFIPHILLQLFTYAVPYLEALMGIFLLFNATRKIALFGILIMHSLIIIMLFYLGYGYNVVPWNLQNISTVFVLFWGYKSISPKVFFTAYLDYKKLIIMFMVFVLPFTNLFNGWDNLLSFSFFSSKLNYYYIQINDKDHYEALPQHIKDYAHPYQETYILYPNEWCGEELKVLLYPEERIIKQVDAYLRSFAKNPNKKGLTKMVVYNH